MLEVTVLVAPVLKAVSTAVSRLPIIEPACTVKLASVTAAPSPFVPVISITSPGANAPPFTLDRPRSTVPDVAVIIAASCSARFPVVISATSATSVSVTISAAPVNSNTRLVAERLSLTGSSPV